MLHKHEASITLENGKQLRLVLKYSALHRLETLLQRRAGLWDLPEELSSYTFVAAYITAAGVWDEIDMKRPASIDACGDLLDPEKFDEYFSAAWQGFGFKEVEEKMKAKEAEEKKREEEQKEDGTEEDAPGEASRAG